MVFEPLFVPDELREAVSDAAWVRGMLEAERALSVVQGFEPVELEVDPERLARDGRRVVVAGLDQDFLGRPFEPVPQLMAVAEHVTKLHAVCVCCGAPANHSQRIVADGARVLVGEKEAYEPRCRHCFDPTGTGAPSATPAPAAATARA